MADPHYPAIITLPAALDLRAAAPLRNDLLSVRGRPVRIDASGVRQVGGQCLQVLLSAHATWQADGHALDVAAASDEFTAGLALLGAALPPLAREA